MIAQLGAKIRSDRFRDLDRGELDAALSDHVPRKRRNGETLGGFAIEKRLDLPVPFHPLGETLPTGALSRDEHGSDERENPRRLNERPRGLVR